MSDQKYISSESTPRQILHQTALKAPSSPGVYLWHNDEDTVIYVGKAKNLKNRLSSYFAGEKDIKTRLLISNARYIEYITTNNEYEAFLLENNLIKKYSPKYNICLKDGKSYPVIRITRDKFPRIFKTRSVIQDGSKYFGPYPDATALDSFIEALYEIYPIRHCRTFREKATPCMYYHIGRCLAPCTGKITQSTYTEFIEEICMLLEGKTEDTAEKIKTQMKEAARNLNFEKAARLRDSLKALEILKNQNVVEGFDNKDRDYVAYWRDGEEISFTVLKIRGGKLLGRENYRTVSMSEDEELIPEFLAAFYTEDNASSIPPNIYVSTQTNLEIMEQYFGEVLKAETKINLVTDKIENSSLHAAALNMAQSNAKEDIIRRRREQKDIPALEELKNLLNLDKLPRRIEGFDIAHIGGKFPVASLISFWDGNPDKKNYRYFRLKTTDGYIDDFASMREATHRRYSRLIREKKELPDLLLIDGGIGQVNAVRASINELGIDIPIAGLAKRDEEIYRPGINEPICLPKRSDALRLLQRVRDETHRFATRCNQELRTKENTVSPFSKIPGIGKARETLLLKRYTTLENFGNATVEELMDLMHIPQQKAEEILSSGKQLLEQQKAKQSKQKLSLQLPGTTAEKAARKKEIFDLAELALEVANDEEI